MDTERGKREPVMQFSIRKMRRVIRKLKLRSGDTILLKNGTSVAQKDAIESLSIAVNEAKLENIMVIVVDDFDDLSVVSEERMNELGWHYLASLKKQIVRRMETKENDNEEKPRDRTSEKTGLSGAEGSPVLETDSNDGGE